MSVHEFIYGFIQGEERIAVSVSNAMLQMVLQDDSRGAAQCRADCGELDQDFGAVPPVLDHPPDRFEMTDRARQTVEHCLGLRVCMTVRVRMIAGVVVIDGMAVNVSVAVIVIINLFFLHDEPRFL